MVNNEARNIIELIINIIHLYSTAKNFAPSSIATCIMTAMARKNGSMLRKNVITEGLFQDLPKFEPPIQGLMSAANVALHHMVVR